MFGAIYALSFSLCVISLILWLLFRASNDISRIMRLIFLITLAVFAVSIILSPVFLPQKLFVLARELIILAVIGFLFKALLKNKIAYTGVFILLLIGLTWYYPVLSSSLTPLLPIPLDESGELLVEVTENADREALEKVINEFELEASTAFTMQETNATELDDYLLINIPDKHRERIDKIRRALKRTGIIDWIEENEKMQIEPVEAKNETRTGNRFGLNDPGIDRQWGFTHMGMERFATLLNSDKISPKKTARIFILDTGVDSGHEDIRGNYHSLREKYDRDIRGHGTHCAGIAGAVSNNGIGIASFSQGSITEITSVKVLSDNGFGTQQGIINGILEASDNGADVISLSLGGRSNTRKQRAYKQAVNYANKLEAIVVVAAGNSSQNARNYSPANTPGVVCVAAIDTNLNLASFSNSLEDIEMGIGAPGVSIYSTIPDNKYDAWNGTSMATPYVAGLIGVLKAFRPDLTTEQVYELLDESGEKSNQTRKSGRLIRADKALEDLLNQ